MTHLRALLGPLKVLDAVYRAGGISKAAGSLHLTQGAISQQLKQLEQMLDIKLLKKEGREARFTEAGQLLASQASQAFDQLEGVVRDAVALGKRQRKLRMTVMPTFAIKWLIPRLASLYALHRDIDIEITTGASASFETPLTNMDFVLRHGKGHWPQACAHRIFDDAYVPVCSPGLAARLRDPADLLQVQLLHSIMIPTAWQLWLDIAGVQGAPALPGMMLGNAALCYQAAIDGLGVAMAQQVYVRDDLAAGRLVQPFDLVARTGLGYFLVCDEKRAQDGTVAIFRKWLEGAVE